MAIIPVPARATHVSARLACMVAGVLVLAGVALVTASRPRSSRAGSGPVPDEHRANRGAHGLAVDAARECRRRHRPGIRRDRGGPAAPEQTLTVRGSSVQAEARAASPR